MNRPLLKDLQRHLYIASANLNGLLAPNREHKPKPEALMALKASLREQVAKIGTISDLMRESGEVLS